MEGIKWLISDNSKQYALAKGLDEWAENSSIDKGEKMTVDEALRENLIEVVQTDHDKVMPQARITNHSSWKIVLLHEWELVNESREHMIGLTVTLQHNASAVIPAGLLSSNFFFDQCMSSIQNYLHNFKAAENQAGMTLHMDDRQIGTHYGEFPLLVEIHYKRAHPDA